MHNVDLSIKNLSKIEGNASLDVKVSDGKVKTCKLNLLESNRFFKEAILGADYNSIPGRVSRICGTCGVSHQLAMVECIENAFGVKVTRQTRVLRNLIMNMTHLRDHAMHLYFFCLPDVFGVDSVFDFGEDKHHLIHDGLDIKSVSNYINEVLGGRAIHPTLIIPGGFSKLPKKKNLDSAIKKLESLKTKVDNLIKIFAEYENNFERKSNYVALCNKDYNFLEGEIKTAKGSIIKEKDYGRHFEKVVRPYSKAEVFKWESKDYFVGALARMNLNKESLHKEVKKKYGEELKYFPSTNIFLNNLAQAIESMNIIYVSIDLLRELKGILKKEKPKKIISKRATGVGVVEAPRGTLYYKFSFSEKGKVVSADFCIPSDQNLLHMENTLKLFIQSLLEKGFNKKKIHEEVEKMIRAYDPCMSCATHFLKINWD